MDNDSEVFEAAIAAAGLENPREYYERILHYWNQHNPQGRGKCKEMFRAMPDFYKRVFIINWDCPGAMLGFVLFDFA